MFQKTADLLLFIIVQWIILEYSFASSPNIIYKQYDYPGQETLADNYLSLMPPIDENKSLYWVRYSAFVYENSQRSSDFQSILEYILITEQDLPFGGDTPYKKAYVLYARRTGPRIIQTIESSLEKNEDCRVIKKHNEPQFQQSTLQKNECVEIYHYTKDIDPLMYFQYWCDDRNYRDKDVLEERMLSGESGHGFYFLPLRNKDQLDLLIILDYRYISVCFLEAPGIKCVLNKFSTYPRVPKSTIKAPGFISMPYWTDINQDGIFEIFTATNIWAQGFDRTHVIPWIACYRWNGSQYIEDNELFYQTSHSAPIFDSLIRVQSSIQSKPKMQESQFIYDYYLGLVYFYRHEYNCAYQCFVKAKKNSKNPCILETSRELMKQCHPFSSSDYHQSP
ncbi:MAG: hypothetical protein JXR73_04220 [Candidatus Omnitrophica bacterium]|nr:hypothetical protein [Candidatus Omnitrophota bacterium]